MILSNRDPALTTMALFQWSGGASNKDKIRRHRLALKALGRGSAAAGNAGVGGFIGKDEKGFNRLDSMKFNLETIYAGPSPPGANADDIAPELHRNNFFTLKDGTVVDLDDADGAAAAAAEGYVAPASSVGATVAGPIHQKSRALGTLGHLRMPAKNANNNMSMANFYTLKDGTLVDLDDPSGAALAVAEGYVFMAPPPPKGKVPPPSPFEKVAAMLGLGAGGAAHNRVQGLGKLHMPGKGGRGATSFYSMGELGGGLPLPGENDNNSPISLVPGSGAPNEPAFPMQPGRPKYIPMGGMGAVMGGFAAAPKPKTHKMAALGKLNIPNKKAGNMHASFYNFREGANPGDAEGLAAEYPTVPDPSSTSTTPTAAAAASNGPNNIPVDKVQDASAPSNPAANAQKFGAMPFFGFTAPKAGHKVGGLGNLGEKNALAQKGKQLPQKNDPHQKSRLSNFFTLDGEQAEGAAGLRRTSFILDKPNTGTAPAVSSADSIEILPGVVLSNDSLDMPPPPPRTLQNPTNQASQARAALMSDADDISPTQAATIQAVPTAP